MRGACCWSLRYCATVGITPAHAGSILNRKRIKQSIRDHPRACGEHFWTTGIRVPAQDHPRACGEHIRVIKKGDSRKGSPPRMRGAYKVYTLFISKARITPAHAGSIFKGGGA